MGFDVVVIDAISDRGFTANGIDDGEPSEQFNGVGHSLEENLNLATYSASDGKAWLTEKAFEQTAAIRDKTYKQCHGVVTNNGYLTCVKYYRHHYGCSFDDSSIVSRFIVEAEISINAPETAYQGDDVAIAVTVTNTGVIAADLGGELYDGDILVGPCAGPQPLKTGQWVMTTYTKTMPDHDWNLTAKVVSDPAIDVTADFTIMSVDPCADVTCPDRCYGAALWSRKCDHGDCIRDALINAAAPTCDFEYPSPKFAVGDHVCTDQSELSGWAPATIDEVYSDGSYRAVKDSGTAFKLALDWEPYYFICDGRDPIIPGEEPIECDTGCDLLKRFDKNSDGTIDADEVNDAKTLLDSGIITQKEYDYVKAAWLGGAGAVNRICPGCQEIDKCIGVVCDQKCRGHDRWSQKCVDGVCVYDELLEANSADCGGGTTCEDVTETCNDGSIVTTWRCVDGVLVATGDTCPHEGCTADITMTCPDGSTVTTYRCTEGTLVTTGDTCPHEEPDDNTTLIIAVVVAALIGLYLLLKG